MIIVDTGPLVAAADSDETHHEQCVREFTRLYATRRNLITTSFVAAEVCYMTSRYGGTATEAEFIRALESGTIQMIELTRPDLARIAVLIERYADLPLGSTDASIIAVAERLKIDEIFTLDVRHFSVVRPAHVPAFRLLPN